MSQKDKLRKKLTHELAALELKPHSIVVAKVNGAPTMNWVQTLVAVIKAAKVPFVNVLLIKEGDSIDAMTDETMNSIGWYRRDKKILTPQEAAAQDKGAAAAPRPVLPEKRRVAVNLKDTAEGARKVLKSLGA